MKEIKKTSLITPGYALTFVLITLLFFLWAFPNTLNDVLITQFKKSLELSLSQTGLLPVALKCGYFVTSIPAGLLMQRKGYKFGLLIGLTLFACGFFLFIPASLVQQFWFFLLAIFITTSGAAFLEIGANSFIVGLGDKSTSERRLNLAQSFNPIGGICAAAAGTFFIFSGNEPTKDQIAHWDPALWGVESYKDFLREENMRVIPTYVVLGILVIIVGLLIWKAKFPALDTPKTSEKEEKGSFRALLKFPQWWGGVISQFFYLGAQLGTWSYLILYIQQNSLLTEKQAGIFLTVNMAIFMVGRFFSTWLMKYVKPVKLMGTYALINICLVTVAILGSGWASGKFGIGLHNCIWSVPFTDLQVPVGIYALIMSTFFMSLMYPTNFASGIKGLGQHTKLGASILVMSLIGGAVLSFIMGRIADTEWAGEAIAPAMIIPIISYCVICWYAFKGSKEKYGALVV
ncbi:L-fucose:H+ symporter permease [Bacteroidia bacterium]|nr:L-fucose:H+ symporter permease [Bacteroidia bacterium]